MFKTRSIAVLLIGVCVISAVLTAQVPLERDVAPLQDWAAPLFWQPTEAEINATEAGSTVRRMRANATATATNLPVGSNALVFVAMTPCRVVDTRASAGFTGAFGPPRLNGGVARTFPIQSSTTCSIPSAAQAYSFNVTVVPSGPLGFLTIYPTGQTRPLSATLNALQGQVVANAAIAPAGASGSVDVFASNNTDLVIDINGYYAAPIDSGANTGLGAGALLNNSGGQYNTATGASALYYNTTGSENTSIGWTSMFQNTTGSHNTAIGMKALRDNTTGAWNTATGEEALRLNQTGQVNTANGFEALFSNIMGSENAAFGAYALHQNIADQNTAFGNSALASNTIGSGNTAIGLGALAGNELGYRNIALGLGAGSSVQGIYNIDIANPGSATDNHVMRIGDSNISETHIDGIWGRATLGGALPVVIDNLGQLGTISSSRRYKEDISDMSEASADLMRLRPVTFRYKQPYADGSKPIDYGLIAEEVAEIYPDLVVRGKDGEVESVQYQKLTPMLLNEAQKQHETIKFQQEEIRSLANRLAALEALLTARSGDAAK